MLPTRAAGSKMIFLGDHTPGQKVILQDKKTLKDTQEKLKYLLDTCIDIM